MYIFEIYTNTHVGEAGKGMAIYMSMKGSVEIGHPNICENMPPRERGGKILCRHQNMHHNFHLIFKIRGKFHFKNHLRDYLLFVL
jgi:hypothetical protein